LFANQQDREFVRKYLIDNNIYPTILWPIPGEYTEKIKEVGDTILSIHCDGRYTSSDMGNIKNILEKALVELHIQKC
jgi:hypothetical protein